MASQEPIQAIFLSIALLITLLNSVQLSEGAPSSAKLESFPGFRGSLRSEIYTGYVTVNDAHEKELFYYFVKSERNPAEDPLLLWLTGGPGCSSFNGFIYEIGPFNFDLTEYSGNLPKLQRNPHSWTKVSNIIFLDSPVGTGFSYSNTTEDYVTGDFKTVSDVYTFLQKWFEVYPEFLPNPIYIGGDSYSGIFVPLVALEIANGIETGVKPTLNLKGYVVGNGVTDGAFDSNAQVPYAHGMGLISDELYQAVKDACNGNYTNPTSEACMSNLQAVWQNIYGLNLASILDPICFFITENQQTVSSQEDPFQSSKQPQLFEQIFAARRRMSGHAWFPKLDGSLPIKLQLGYQDMPCSVNSYQLSNVWANNPSVRKAIHAQTKEITGLWQRCAYSFEYRSDVASAVKYHLNLTRRGYRALIYNGDHDLIVPFIGTQSWIRSLGYAIVDEWRSWFVDGQVAGL